MTLGTHAAVGGTLAALVPSHPVVAFIIGFLSHFVLDSIPHYDYRLTSMKKDKVNKMDNDIKIGKDFVLDLFRLAFDVFLGFLILFIFFRHSSAFPLIIAIGAIAAMLPDALQFVYFKYRHEPVYSLQRFHMFIHADGDLDDKPFFGLACQTVVIALTLFLVLGVLQ